MILRRKASLFVPKEEEGGPVKTARTAPALRAQKVGVGASPLACSAGSSPEKRIGEHRVLMAKPPPPFEPKRKRGKVEEKVEQRLKKYKKVEQGAFAGGKGLLETQSVAPRSAPDYKKWYDQFLAFCTARNIPSIAAPGLIDAAMVDHADELFFEGKKVADGEKLLAAVAYFDSRFSRGGSGHLPRYRRALKGWKRLGPDSSRIGAPELVVFGIAMVLLYNEEKRKALWVLLVFCCYLRPSEGMGLAKEDLIEPVSSSTVPASIWSVLLGPTESGKPTKVGIYDDSVTIDLSPYKDFLPEQLQRLKQDSLPGACVWDFDYDDINKSFQDAAKLLRIFHLVYCLYQLRHGGVSADLLRKRREFGEAKKRGRWSTDQCVRRYERHGKLQQTISKIPKDIFAYCELSYKMMGTVLSGKSKPLKPPPALPSA